MIVLGEKGVHCGDVRFAKGIKSLQCVVFVVFFFLSPFGLCYV